MANGGYLLTLAGSGNTTISGVLSGGGGLTLNGTGLTSLTAANSYTGGTTVNAGELDLGYQNSGYGTIRGTLTINSGALVKTTVAGAFGYNASASDLTAVNINAGTLLLAGNANETVGCAFSLTGGTLSSNGSSSYLDAGTFGGTPTSFTTMLRPRRRRFRATSAFAGTRYRT